MAKYYNEKRKESIIKYLNKQKILRFYVKPELYEEYVEAQNELGYPSMRKFVMDAIAEKIENKTPYVEKNDEK